MIAISFQNLGRKDLLEKNVIHSFGRVKKFANITNGTLNLLKYSFISFAAYLTDKIIAEIIEYMLAICWIKKTIFFKCHISNDSHVPVF